MTPLVGLGLGGPTHTPRDLSPFRLGEPIWGPAALLRDIELRLGLPPPRATATSRIPRYKARIEALAAHDAFYARSFEADAIGTTSTLLAWRDGLVDAGWDGAVVPGGGDRLAALAALEASPVPLPDGDADRLARVDVELCVARSHPYERLTLADSKHAWPRRWQVIFDRLEALGTVVDAFEPTLPGAPPDTDLGLLQRLLRADTTLEATGASARVRGDGSITVLRGETPADLAALLAAVLAGSTGAGALIVRGDDPSILEAALLHHGLAAQGHRGESPWRPATQILPLALELAFEPRDPHRVLELLTLPVGPFRGRLGGLLARAVVRQPGVLGQEWTRRKQQASEALRAEDEARAREEGKSDEQAITIAEARAAARLRRVAEWLESPGVEGGEIARSRLVDIAARVRSLLVSRMGNPGEAHVYQPALSQLRDFDEAIAHGTSPVGREELRHLFDSVARRADGHEISTETAGRLAHALAPAAVLAPARTVVFWDFIAGAERRPVVVPWNAAERRALGDAGVTLPDPRRMLAEEARGWRGALLAASERVIFAIPRARLGAATAPHPIWDEIVARLGLDEDAQAIARLTRDASSVLRDPPAALAVTALPVLPLPRTDDLWRISPAALAGASEHRTHATAVESLVGCPLAWALDHRARLRSGAVARVAAGPLLNGGLGHRLVEELFRAGAFDLDEAAFLSRATTILEVLVRTEGATLLLEGAGFELAQLLDQLRGAARALHRYLRRTGFRIAGVEEEVTMGATPESPGGRLDLRLVDEHGEDAVLDLKWGAAMYRSHLRRGRAIQLAVYVLSLAAAKGQREPPPAAYFALGQGRVLTADPRMKMGRETLDGPSLVETWSRVERTQSAVRAALARGDVAVADTRRGRPLLEQLGVPEAERERCYDAGAHAACEHCGFATLCGRAWRALG